VPTFLAGRYLMVGAQPYDELKRLIEHVMESLSEPAAQ
jgi:predicted DsbA family dithiol-disulfide isomerase